MSEHATAVMSEIEAEAKARLRSGAVTPAYGSNKDAVIQALNDSLATELVCMLRYTSHAMQIGGPNEALAEEFREHAREEHEHALALAERICQLGGTPDFNPQTLIERSHAQFSAGGDPKVMVRENLIAERVAIQVYTDMVRALGNDDPTTRRLIEDILATEEEHADDLTSFLDD